VRAAPSAPRSGKSHYNCEAVSRLSWIRRATERFDPVAFAVFDIACEINVYARCSTGCGAGGASARSLTYDVFEGEEVTLRNRRKGLEG
jgi:hypothetical protein